MNGTGESFTGPVTAVSAAVAKIYGLSLTELIGPGKARSVYWPRHVAMYLAYEMTGHSAPQIGRVMGGRDHSTVFSGIRRVRTEMEQNPDRKREVERVMEAVRQDQSLDLFAQKLADEVRDQLIASLRETVASCTLTLRILGVEDPHAAP